ncbi:hypothetical protein WN51_03929 [Melipona quadrifasciata]|uniref:Uncharacterized protein n=1 Tax=Melipona quadrifasciata TaxID=166423 RepID=A0A0M8ZS02_9HYME|nr:hypothetical protein WN51_03929 [Melipona quadrifasciata]
MEVFYKVKVEKMPETIPWRKQCKIHKAMCLTEMNNQLSIMLPLISHNSRALFYEVIDYDYFMNY